MGVQLGEVVVDQGRSMLLVVLCDGNPAAALLTVLSVRFSKLIIAHTRAASDDAARLAAVVASTRPSGPAPELFDCGDGDDPTGMSARLAELPVSAPYRLDYTGGSRVQAMCAVWRHLDDHVGLPDSHGLRSYVDNRSRTILFDGEGSAGAVTEGCGASLSLLAQLEGFKFVAGSRIFLAADSDKRALTDALNLVHKRVVQRHSANSIVKSLTNLRSHFTDFPPAEEFNSKSHDATYGVAAEILTAAFFAYLLNDAGPDIEIMQGVKATPDRNYPSDSSEFDVLIRSGMSVWVVETKSSTRNSAEEISRRETFARLVFGAEARVVMVTVPEPGQDWMAQLLRRRVRQFTAPIGSRTRAHSVSLATLDGFDEVLAAIRPAAPASHTPAAEHPPAAGPNVDLLVCGLGARSGVRSVIGEIRPESVGVLTIAGHPINAQIHPAGHTIETGDLTATTAFRIAGATGPNTLGITSGPKSVLAGFVRYAYENPAVDLVHLDRRAPANGVRSVYRGNPVRGWRRAARSFSEPWDQDLTAAGFRPLAATSSAHPASRSLLIEAERRGITAWRSSTPSPGVDQLVLVGAHATTSVTVVGAPVGGQIRSPKPGAARHAVLDFEAEVESVVGGLNHNLVVLPPGYVGEPSQSSSPRVRSWTLLAEENNWFSLGSWDLGAGDLAVVQVSPRLWIELGG